MKFRLLVKLFVMLDSSKHITQLKAHKFGLWSMKLQNSEKLLSDRTWLEGGEQSANIRYPAEK